MALGLINLDSKEDLQKLDKEQLINLVIDRSNELKNFMEKIINMNEEELIEYQKYLQLVKEMSNIFKLTIDGR